MTQSDERTRRAELAAFLRKRRERLAPAALGLPAGTRRRTPGLRREEVALHSGISVTWYTWLEQARDIELSATALARLAATLCLDRAERAYLFGLAGRRDPAPPAPPDSDLPIAVAVGLRAIGAPAYLLDRTWRPLAWTAAAEALFVGWLDRTPPASLLEFIFLEPGARRFIEDWPARAARVVAEFRADAAAFRGAPDIDSAIEALRRDSPSFAELWDDRRVLEREGGTRRFNHPREGLLSFEQISFVPTHRPDLRLVMLTPS